MKQRTLAGQWAGSFDFYDEDCANEYGTLKAEFVQHGPAYSGEIEENVITAQGPLNPNFSRVTDIQLAPDGRVSFKAIWISGKIFEHTGTLDKTGNRITGVWQHSAFPQPGGTFILARCTEKPTTPGLTKNVEKERDRTLEAM